MDKERVRESVCELKTEPRPVHGEMGAGARVWWLLDGDRVRGAVSRSWAVVQGVEASHWLVSWGIKKKEREMPLSMGSRGGHAPCGQHGLCVCPGSRRCGAGVCVVQRDKVGESGVVCAHGSGATSAPWTPA